jgi:hypothetical protein
MRAHAGCVTDTCAHVCQLLWAYTCHPERGPGGNISSAIQALAFLAGANSIFSGDKLLTTPNPDADDDSKLFQTLGLKGRPAFLPYAAGEESSRHGVEAL